MNQLVFQTCNPGLYREIALHFISSLICGKKVTVEDSSTSSYVGAVDSRATCKTEGDRFQDLASFKIVTAPQQGTLPISCH